MFSFFKKKQPASSVNANGVTRPSTVTEKEKVEVKSRRRTVNIDTTGFRDEDDSTFREDSGFTQPSQSVVDWDMLSEQSFHLSTTHHTSNATRSFVTTKNVKEPSLGVEVDHGDGGIEDKTRKSTKKTFTVGATTSQREKPRIPSTPTFQSFSLRSNATSIGSRQSRSTRPGLQGSRKGPSGIVTPSKQVGIKIQTKTPEALLPPPPPPLPASSVPHSVGKAPLREVPADISDISDIDDSNDFIVTEDASSPKATDDDSDINDDNGNNDDKNASNNINHDSENEHDHDLDRDHDDVTTTRLQGDTQGWGEIGPDEVEINFEESKSLTAIKLNTQRKTIPLVRPLNAQEMQHSAAAKKGLTASPSEASEFLSLDLESKSSRSDKSNASLGSLGSPGGKVTLKRRGKTGEEFSPKQASPRPKMGEKGKKGGSLNTSSGVRRNLAALGREESFSIKDSRLDSTFKTTGMPSTTLNLSNIEGYLWKRAVTALLGYRKKYVYFTCWKVESWGER